MRFSGVYTLHRRSNCSLTTMFNTDVELLQFGPLRVLEILADFAGEFVSFYLA